jgi:hypothetical protein
MNRELVGVIAILLIVSAVIYLEDSREGTPPENTGVSQTSALLVLDGSTYHVGDNMTLTIINNGNKTLLLGEYYMFYRFENGSWKAIETGLTFTMIGYMIPPGGSWSQRVPLAILVKGGSAFGTLKPLPPGRYRIVKTVSVEDRGPDLGRKEITLSAEFEIVE